MKRLSGNEKKNDGRIKFAYEAPRFRYTFIPIFNSNSGSGEDETVKETNFDGLSIRGCFRLIVDISSAHLFYDYRDNFHFIYWK